MTTYARLNPEGSAVEGLVELTADEYAGMQVNGKAARLRVWVPTAAPVPNASQVVEPAPPVIDAINVTQAWELRSKTADELEFDALQTERAQLTQYIADIQTQLDISNATRGAMTTNQRFNTLESDTRATMKAVKFLLRQTKRAL
jgi:hypothetical protein